MYPWYASGADPEQRLSFALEVNSIIKEKATLDMTEKERQAFLD
jgi:hypothetical protein